MGAIGQKVAQIAEAFGCRILCYSASGSKYDFPGRQWEQTDFDTFLKESDIISIHAPLNSHTENLMNLDAFRKMKETAVLINVARGPIVNQEDLCTALAENMIAGAGLDVLKNRTHGSGRSHPEDPGQPEASDHAPYGVGACGDKVSGAEMRL